MKETKNVKKENFSRKINYPVGDFLIRLKNAVIAGNHEVSAPSTKLIKSVANVLKSKGYIEDVREEGKQINVTLTIRRKEPVLMDIKLVSKPGLRVYKTVDEISAKRGPSMSILSTPLGVMSAKDAIKKRTGGELIAEIY